MLPNYNNFTMTLDSNVVKEADKIIAITTEYANRSHLIRVLLNNWVEANRKDVAEKEIEDS